MYTKFKALLAKEKSPSAFSYIESSACAIILIVPILANIYWLSTVAHLPSDDAACYLEVAYEHYKAFFDTPIIPWLRDVYMVRGWTQILFPVFALPLLFIFGGNALLSVTVLAASAYALLVYFTYKLANLYISRIPAALASVVATTMSAYFIRYTVILHFSESLWLLFSVISFYYIIKSEYFTKNRETVIGAIFFALTINIRPVESVTICLIPMALVLRAHLRSSKEAKAYVRWALSYAFASFLILVIFAFIKIPGPFVFGFAFVSVLSIYVIRCKMLPGKLTNVELFSLISCAIIVLWWSPKMPELFFYSYQCTFGEAAALTDNHPGLAGKIHILKTLLSSFNIQTLAFLFVLACAALIVNYKEKLQSDVAMLGGIAVGMLAPIVLMLLLTETSTPRRCYVPVFFLTICMSVYAMRAGKFTLIRTFAIAVLCLMQLKPLYPFFSNSPKQSWSVTGSFSMNSYQGKNRFAPNFAIIDKLNELKITPGSIIAVYSHSTYTPHLRCYEVWSLLLAKSIKKAPYNFRHFRTTTFGQITSPSQQQYTYLLVDSIGGAGSTQVIPYSQTVEALVQVATSGDRLPKHTLVDSFEMCGRQHYLYKAEFGMLSNTGQGPGNLSGSGAVYSTTAHNFSGRDWDKGIHIKDGYHTFYFIIKKGETIPVKVNDEVVIADEKGKVTKVTSCPSGSEWISVFVTTTIKISPKTGGYPNPITIIRR